MSLRGTIIAALFVVELAIVGEMVVALGGGQPARWSTVRAGAATASGTRLVEGGPHQLFDAGTHPALNVDIGYADLTIVTGKAAQVDVSVGASDDFGIFRAKDAITAHQDGSTVQIAKAGEHGWSMGDDRRVTVLVPPETQVTVVNAGDITVNGLRADASIKSVGSGSVTVEDYDAQGLRITSSDGPIVMRQVAALRLDATSSDGRIEGTGLRVRDGTVDSSDGRVSLGFAKGADTLVTAQTSSGKIRLSGLTAASASDGGEDGDEDAAARTVRIGAGTGRLEVHTSDGNIRLTQET